MASTKTTRPRPQKAEQAQQEADHAAAEDKEIAALREMARAHARICALITRTVSATEGIQSSSGIMLSIGRVCIHMRAGEIVGTELRDDENWASAMSNVEEGAALYAAGFIRSRKAGSVGVDVPEDDF